MNSVRASIGQPGNRLAGIGSGPRSLAIGIGLLLITAIVALIYATRFGPWIFSDSVEYIVSARNFLMGRGIGLQLAAGEFQPIYLHPPFYPVALSALGVLGADLVTVARWLNIALFALSILRLTVE